MRVIHLACTREALDGRRGNPRVHADLSGCRPYPRYGILALIHVPGKQDDVVHSTGREPLNVSAPKLQSAALFVSKIITVINSRDAANGTVAMIQHRFDHMRRNAQPRHSRCASPPQIMKCPMRYIGQRRIELCFRSAKARHGCFAVCRKDEILPAVNAWQALEDRKCSRAKRHAVRNAVLASFRANCPNAPRQIDLGPARRAYFAAPRAGEYQ
jgi:hypothetical protein